jgi:predicted dehydrogenase
MGKSDDDFPVAVLGTGSIGQRHLNVLSQISGVQPVAVPVRRSRVEELQSDGFLVAKSLEHARTLGSRACIIATETGRHAADAVAAANMGFDVLVEKPLTTDSPSARAVCSAFEHTQHQMFVACVLRFYESIDMFRRRIGQIGPVHSVSIECESYLPDWRPDRDFRASYSSRPNEGGVLRDLIHEIDYAGWLFGWPMELHAMVRNSGRLGIEAEESATLMWETADRCLVRINLDYLTRPQRRRMRAAGEHGVLEWDGIRGEVVLELAGEPVQVERSSETRDEMLKAQDHAFIAGIMNGGEFDLRLATGDEGVRALAVCDSARRSSTDHCGVQVTYS